MKLTLTSDSEVPETSPSIRTVTVRSTGLVLMLIADVDVAVAPVP